MLISFVLVPFLISLFSFEENQWPERGLQDAVHWKLELNAPVFASPVVDDKTVYVGALDSILYAIDIASGRVLWKYKTGGEIRSAVVIKGNKLLLNGGDGNVYALDKKSGSMEWSFQTEGEKKYDFADYFHSTPVLLNDKLYFGSGDGHLYCIGVESGELVWKFRTGDVIHGTPAIDNGKVFFGSFDGFVYALVADTGTLIWKFKTVGQQYFPRGEVQGSPTAFNGWVFIGARDYNVYALDQEKGYCHWNKAFDKGWGLVSQVHDSVLFIGTADQRVLISADPATGRERWKLNMEFLVFGNFAFADQLMFVGTTIGKVHAIDVSSGKKVWSFRTTGYGRNRAKYFKEDDSYRDDIYTLIKSNEEFLEVELELGGIFSAPVLTADHLIFTSTEGSIYCLSRPATHQ